MTSLIIVSVIAGMLCGYFIMPQNILDNINILSTIFLSFLILSVGIDVGSNKNLIKNLKKSGLKIILIPICIIIGSFAGGIVTALIYGLSFKSSLSIASGFGWYSLSGIMLTNLDGAQVGTTAFLTNIFRELIAVVLIPIIAVKLNHYTTIAPAGATSMDTTLPLISKATSPEIAVVSFLNGVILSSLVPVFISFFYTLKW
ncbi:lysine exporter LysO family protein [Clostridium thailandense]|uniref:Lysine exporter LysO family protein n=1 Tax=Clostridium thailandense TaxID=2794346 RepID=A0A949U590_9CLOT|nr:lysine exporter LysO family protein [Clostridium thailandense]MBV7276689.1 lysine exporter LysO family protein [Clostridium thailandense]MCH5135647.1 lysine exporter LysO family protein [Clostridiaceae bacterium UIB06]